MKPPKPEVPLGLQHLEMVDYLILATKARSEKFIKAFPQSTLIGIALFALYQAATCHRKCWGTGHIFEALCGRAYNLACSAYLLISSGFYDEALNLIRGIGEIANLVSFSAVDKDAFRRWLEADPKARRREFSPVKVRKILEQKGRELMYADDDWYARLCDKYTHVNPGTRPNLHNDSGIPMVGGIYQEAGAEQALDELTATLGFLTLQVCMYFQFDDLFQKLTAELRAQSANDPES